MEIGTTLLIILGFIVGALIGGAIILYVGIKYMCDGFWKDLTGDK